MKKIFILAAIMMTINLATKAQGNLQFNRVVSYTGGYANGSTVILDTVKQGKVIKIESMGISSNYFNGVIRINGKAYYNVPQNYTSPNIVIHEPLWLKAGDVISYTPNGNGDYVITGIEYNIVP